MIVQVCKTIEACDQEDTEDPEYPELMKTILKTFQRTFVVQASTALVKMDQTKVLNHLKICFHLLVLSQKMCGAM